NKRLDCHVALFSMDENNPYIRRHCRQGGLSAVLENGFITICKGTWKLRVDEAAHIPLSFGGKAGFMIQNILAAVLAAYIRQVKPDDIRLALRNFYPDAEHTPGRMNHFRVKDFNVLVDYAHNSH